MVTQRSVLLGFVGFCFYLIALVNNLPAFYYALTWLAVGLLSSSLGIALLALVGLEASWHCEQSRGVESMSGETENPPVLGLFLANKGTFNKTGLVFEVSLRSLGGARAEGQMVTQRFVIEALTSGTSLQTSLPLRTLPRGHYEIAHVKLIGSDILGLFRTQRHLRITAEEKVTLQVAPGVLTLTGGLTRMGSGPGKRPGELEARLRVGNGEDLRGTRPYAPGDDLRRVHWKSTARAGELVVKEHHERGRDVSAVVWDGAQGTDWGHGSATEWALRAVHSCHLALSRYGNLSDLFLLQEGPVSLQSSGQRGVSPEQVSAALAPASADRASTMSAGARGLPGDYFLIYIISGSLAPDLVALVQQCLARRTQVHVLLLEGHAFSRSGNGLYRSGRNAEEPEQTFTEPDKPGSVSRLVATEAAFAKQYHALQKAGARVSLLQPVDGSAQDMESHARTVLSRFLEGRESGSPSVEVVSAPPEKLRGRQVMAAGR